MAKRIKVGPIRLYIRRGHWHYDYHPSPTQRIRGSLHTTDRATAEAEALRLAHAFQAGQGLPMPGMHLGQLAAEFDQNYAGWSDATKQANKHYSKILLAEFGNRSIDALSALEVNRWLARRMQRDGLSASTRNRYIAYVRRLFAMAVDWGWLPHNPMLSLKQIKEAQQVPQALTADELNRLLAHLPEPAKSIVTLAADTGIRKGALYGLTWAQLDYERKLIHVQQTKTKRGRLIPMSSRVYALLQQMQAANSASATPRLTVLPPYDIRKPLGKAAQAAGLGHIHMHMFRHTCATRLLESGADLRYVQELLGHANISMTARYAHVRTHKLHEVVQQMEAAEGQ